MQCDRGTQSCEMAIQKEDKENNAVETHEGDQGARSD